MELSSFLKWFKHMRNKDDQVYFWVRRFVNTLKVGETDCVKISEARLKNLFPLQKDKIEAMKRARIRSLLTKIQGINIKISKLEEKGSENNLHIIHGLERKKFKIRKQIRVFRGIEEEERFSTFNLSKREDLVYFWVFRLVKYLKLGVTDCVESDAARLNNLFPQQEGKIKAMKHARIRDFGIILWEIERKISRKENESLLSDSLVWEKSNTELSRS